ncbi:MAG: dihydroorotate dehydrogenase electron transfer subunit [Coriobacteriia bacterium]|nr:dihydroorotate dehydrogenase electron transfer subunit [Coriobacteriia bacterium]
MINANAKVVSNINLTGNLWQIVLAIDELPELVIPGQYVHLRLEQKAEHMLRRPFSVHRVAVTSEELTSLTLTYQVFGEFTQHMTGLVEGDSVDLLGPLGQGWRLPVRAKAALIVGGGVGWAALAMAAGSLPAFSVPTYLLVGARNADYLQALSVGINDRPYPLDSYGSAAELGASFIHLATDDGSLGHHGMNTELLEELCDNVEFDYIAACGPEPMLVKVAALALERGISCEVSLERRMACGMGSCLSCTVQTRSGSRKVCSDGPVFGAGEIIW